MTRKAKHPHDKNRPAPERVRRAIESGDIEALQKVLSIRQRRFAEEYVYDFKGQAAAIRAGYAPTYAARQAYVLLKHDGVRAYVDHLSRNKETNIVSINPEYVIQKVTEIISKETANDTNRLRGLELLARHLGMFIDRTEITGKDGGPIETQQIEEEAQSFNDLLRILRDKRQAEVEQKVDVEIV